MSDSDAQSGIPLLDPEFDPTATSKKRKRSAEESTQDTKKALKKAKRKEKKKLKLKEINEDDLDQELGVNRAFERMDSQLVADYQRGAGGQVLADEDGAGYEWVQGPPDVGQLVGVFEEAGGKMEATDAKPTGAPHTLVVTASGIRAADVFRSLKAGLPKVGVKNPNVAKLFAKHMKVAEQVEHLKKNKVDFGVGTPDRLSTLLDQNALSTANLKRVVVDVSYIDQKKRGILDMKDLHEPLIKLLLRKEFVGDDDDGDGLFMFY
ncbi:hypothetical protein GRF29_1g3226472 [Pseudopithomyces chartarum]|uniref:Protein CMS1 n=1 Tax=Pseudopithomyces chartarum TaxID=1892770 RepID=A0AAN6M7X9_9PLEO|nr:hypothetical protein GRF29_1g3226472 [Pseudopithomyces chartarum]